MPGHESASIQQPDTSWKAIYRAGAICTAIAVIMYVSALIMVIVVPAAPSSGGAQVLEYVHANRTSYLINQILWVAPSLLLIVTFLALTVAFYRLNHSLGLVAGAVGVLSWAVSLALPTTGGGATAMVLLSDRYVAATGAARGAFVGAAEALLAQNEVPAAIGIMQTLGILLIALLMLKGTRFRGLAWFGVATGVIGIVSEALRPMIGSIYAIYGTLLFIWMIWVAAALWRLGNEAP
jgi:hypothetical protein